MRLLLTDEEAQRLTAAMLPTDEMQQVSEQLQNRVAAHLAAACGGRYDRSISWVDYGRKVILTTAQGQVTLGVSGCSILIGLENSEACAYLSSFLSLLRQEASAQRFGGNRAHHGVRLSE